MAALRVLVVSNLYPPHVIGGYELGCRDVVEGLRTRGHAVQVLTSSYGVGAPQTDGRVHRLLDADFDVPYSGLPQTLVRVVAKEVRNQRAFAQVCRRFRPHVVYAWNLAHVSVSAVHAAKRLQIPVSYYVSDQWLSRWMHADAWHGLMHGGDPTPNRKLTRRVARLVAAWSGLVLTSGDLDYRHVQFASSYLRDHAVRAGLPVAAARVIHWGVDVERFQFRDAVRQTQKLLYSGQLVRHKGVHTAITALSLLGDAPGGRTCTLSIVGGTVRPEYEAELRALVADLGLTNRVLFTGLIPRNELPVVYADHDVLLFPSAWDEPFSITLLEAMASGLAIVSTATGGSSELLRHGYNALVFPKEAPDGCAARIADLLRRQELCERIRLNGRRVIEERFRLDQMVDRIEEALLAAAE